MTFKKNKIKELFIYPEKAFYKEVFSIAVTIALQNLITFGVNLTDTMMVGTLGETELAAASLANQFISVFQTLIMGMSMGASVLLARYWGMKKIDSLQKSDCTSAAAHNRYRDPFLSGSFLLVREYHADIYHRGKGNSFGNFVFQLLSINLLFPGGFNFLYDHTS